MSQPTVTADKGVILTFGILSGADRCAIVMPVFTDSTLFGPVTLVQDAVSSADTNLSTLLADCLATDSLVLFIQGEGMIDGMIPSRLDYAPADFPGTRTGDAMPSSCGAIMGFYRDPADPLPSTRVSLGKNIIPGISADDVTGDVISLDLQNAVIDLADMLVTGWASTGDSGNKWYRASVAVPRANTSDHIPRCASQIVRRYIGTQRRRLIPH